jgi:hypothetical protein
VNVHAKSIRYQGVVDINFMIKIKLGSTVF